MTANGNTNRRIVKKTGKRKEHITKKPLILGKIIRNRFAQPKKKSIDLYRISTFLQSQLPHIPHIFYISIADYKKEKYIPSRVTDA
jgi:hypothetical protein